MKKDGVRTIRGLDEQKKAPAQSKLSSKILDMKFMQRANAKEREIEAKAEEKRRDDQSKWSLKPVNKKTKAKRKQTVSYADIFASEEEPLEGRRRWQDFNAPPEPEPEKAENVSDDEETQLKRKNPLSQKPKKKKAKRG
ncbi:hypothetical protein TRVA0_049S00672 [Trichomonascus vanleenenianus]|uniref:uncharacterized protein n=1 Tax=Trichomonascus vanleenenianus TaxID=2268995 RepID=UPI003ECA7CA1